MTYFASSLAGICLTIFTVFSAVPIISAVDDNNQILEIETPASSYFDEIYRLHKYAALAKEVGRKSDILEDSQGPWRQALQAFGIFNDRQFPFLYPAFDTSDFLSRLGNIDATEPGSNLTISSKCVNDTGSLIIGLVTGESWTYQFLDAAGKPGPSLTKGWWNFVGSYDQCKDAWGQTNTTQGVRYFRGGYFTQPVMIRGVPLPINFGFCLPDTCSSKQVTSLFQGLGASVSSITVGVATEQKVVTEITTATVFAILIFVVTGTLAILGTFYDVYLQGMTILGNKKSESDEKGASVTNGSTTYGSASISQSSNPDDEAQPLLPVPTVMVVNTKPSICGQLLLAFSLYSNGKKLLSTKQSEGTLGSIHGIRFLSMTWVVLGHCYLFGALKNTLNYTTGLPTLLHRWTFDAIVNALVSVDTFFTLSGLLVSYLMLQNLWKNGLRISWGKFYFHRFWRLTPPYMFALVIFLGLQQYMGKGPFWSIDQPADKKNCENNWWTNLLYINNLVKPTEMCYGVSWYLSNDMQFFIISPLMLVPFYFHWAAGIASCLCVLLTSWIATGVLSYHYGWQTTIFEVMQDPSSHWFDKYYIVPWCRIGPYIMGILAGFVLAKYKTRPFRMPRWGVVVGWSVAIGAALAVLYGVHGDISGENVSSRSVAAFYNTVSRSIWGACVCWVIVACAMGYGGPVNALLSWSPFVMLGRLTYMTYLVHLPILNIFFTGMGSLYYFNETIMPVMFLGLLVFSNMVSFVFVLLFESPMIGLEKVLLRKERQD